MEDLAIDGKPGPKETENIQGALASSSRVVVITMTTDDDTGWDGRGQLISYRVSSFKTGAASSDWSKTFTSAGKAARPGVALLWAAGAPAKVQPDVQPLSWLGEDLLVCAGPIQDILCLESNTGKERWRVERIWEFERHFIGPSVWQHEFGRFGEDDVEKKNEKSEKDQKTEKKPSTRQHSIIGGPVVVDLPKDQRGGQDRSIFVAVANGPNRYGEYLSDCVLYELGSSGRPVAMVNLPRMIRGSEYRVQQDGLVWACQGGALVKVGVSRQRDPGIGMGPGGPDLLCRIDWYRHLSPKDRDAWLTSEPAGDPLGFGDQYAFRVLGGGYVTDPEAGIYQFPLSIIDLKTGADRELVLRVPYKGKIPEPETNYSRSTSPQGKDRWQTMGPHFLAITGLQVEGKRLHVTLGMEKWAKSLEFDIDELQGPKRK